MNTEDTKIIRKRIEETHRILRQVDKTRSALYDAIKKDSDFLFLALYEMAIKNGFGCSLSNELDNNPDVKYKGKVYKLTGLFLDREDLVLRAILNPFPDDIKPLDKCIALSELKLVKS